MYQTRVCYTYLGCDEYGFTKISDECQILGFSDNLETAREFLDRWTEENAHDDDITPQWAGICSVPINCYFEEPGSEYGDVIKSFIRKKRKWVEEND